MNQLTELKARRQELPFEAFRMAVTDAGDVQGYGSVFNNINSKGSRVRPGAFSKSIAKHLSEGTRPLMLWQHVHEEPIGAWNEFSEDSIGLRLKGKFNLKTSRGRDAHEHVKAGDLNGLSVGVQIVDLELVGDVADLIELDLWETSVVSFPADSRARISAQASSRSDIERLLRDGGLPRAAAVKVAAGGWAALMSGDDVGADDLDHDAIAHAILANTEKLKSL